MEKLKGDQFEDLSNQGIMTHRYKKLNIIALYKSFLEKLDIKAKFCLLSQLEQSMVIAVNYLKKLANKKVWDNSKPNTYTIKSNKV